MDTAGKLLSLVKPVHKKCNAPSMFFLRDIRYRALNALAIWRNLESFKTLHKCGSYKDFKAILGQQITFHSALEGLVVEGFGNTIMKRYNPEAPFPPSFATPPTSPVVTSKKKKKKGH